jgi:hypothetical protein
MHKFGEWKTAPYGEKPKQVIDCRKARKGEDTQGLGIITFGKPRPCKTKFVDVDITYDEKAKKELYEAGMLALKNDPEAVIEYAVIKALKELAKKTLQA